MMDNQVIARRYAKGLLLSLAKESLVPVEEQLQVFADLLAYGSSDFMRLSEDSNFSVLERRHVHAASDSLLGRALHLPADRGPTAGGSAARDGQADERDHR